MISLKNVCSTLADVLHRPTATVHRAPTGTGALSTCSRLQNRCVGLVAACEQHQRPWQPC